MTRVFLALLALVVVLALARGVKSVVGPVTQRTENILTIANRAAAGR